MLPFFIFEKSYSMNQENWILASLSVFSTTGKKTGKQSKKCYRREKNPKSKPYDNAYFFIFFVMLFYSFLALTVFLGYSCSKKAISKKDLYQEFNESEHWNKNVTLPWRRSITLKTKVFFEHWNKDTVPNTCRRLLSQGERRHLMQLIPAWKAKLLPKRRKKTDFLKSWFICKRTFKKQHNL